jgi:hypothetical protein
MNTPGTKMPQITQRPRTTIMIPMITSRAHNHIGTVVSDMVIKWLLFSR